MASKFNLNFKKIGSDPKFIIGAVIAVGGIVVGIFTYFNLPGRVEALEKDIPKCQDAIKELANTVNNYIQVQAAKEEEREKREDLMVSMFQELLKANGHN